MLSSRASQEQELTPSLANSQPVVTTRTPAAESGSQALVLTRDAAWLVGVGALYVLLVVAAVLTIHPYFSQTWDAVTFVESGKTALSPDWNALYAQTRADRYWPYAYPPLHAFLVAPFVAAAGLAPDYLLVRLPPLLFDLALGILLYQIVGAKTRQKNLARLAMALWLLNPVTWYDTAVQGHFEAEWLFFIVLGYWLFESKRGWLLPTLSFAAAFLFKQNALLFTLPFWAALYFGAEAASIRRLVPILGSMLLYGGLIALVSLPFLAYSNDYLFMNVQYVSDVPLQTQSWLVGVAGLFGNDNLLFRASSVLTFVAAALISILAIRRGMSLWLTATLIALAFFLLSKKVVGYYYVMLLPFALVALIPAQRFHVLSLLIVAISFISLAPYFASWTNPEHWWVYALLGVANSVLWLGLFVWLWRAHPLADAPAQNARTPVFLSLALLLSAVAACLVQPFVNSQTSPIRAPLLPQGAEAQVVLVFLGMLALVAVALAAAYFFSRTIARERTIPASAYALVVLLAPLYFLTFTLTKESTAAVEVALKTLGL